jgi:hypothetical protein
MAELTQFIVLAFARGIMHVPLLSLGLGHLALESLIELDY